MAKPIAMVAFGGNALLRSGQKGTFSEQLENVERTCEQLIPLIERGYNIIIGHGNGPQVGNVMLQHEAGAKEFGLQAMPMDFCGAETQGSIAYLIETAMERVLCRRGIDRPVVSIVTRVEVDPDDPMFMNPTKPVGPYYTEEVAARLSSESGAIYRKDPKGRGYRKVVASPEPKKIFNIGIVRELAETGCIVVTVGGGGIPVVKDGNGHKGVEAVIDKDLASALCAKETGAEVFYILTDVPKVCLNFNTPEQKDLDVMTIEEAEKYLAEGQFAEGSMAPKVRAGIRFVALTGGECIITEAGQLDNPSCGTRIIR